jgi:hypothetical protein
MSWTVSRVGETERAKEPAVNSRAEQMREVRDKYLRRSATQPQPEPAPSPLPEGFTLDSEGVPAFHNRAYFRICAIIDWRRP